MRKQDFVRHLPDSQHHFGRGVKFWHRVHVDPVILLLLLFVTAYGLVNLYSGSAQSEHYLKRQIIFFAVAYFAMFGVAQIKLDFVRRWSPLLYLIGIVMLVLVIFFGVGAKGAQRWISLGFMRFQPSEILKLAVPIAVAAYFSSRQLPPTFKHILGCLIIIFLPAMLIFRQPDLGTALLIAISGIIVLFLAGLSWKYILGSLIVIGASMWPMWQFFMKDYQKQRVLTLFNPDTDKLGAGWNIWQSKTAIGSGGLSGKGWLEGTQSQLDFLPESHTDFIIAVLSEEFGFLGFCVLILMYLAIIARGLIIAIKAQNSFSRLLAGSITLTFFVYIFVNIGMVSGLIPVVGVPLPLVSHGGTSIVTLMMGFGLLMAIATEPKKVSA